MLSTYAVAAIGAMRGRGRAGAVLSLVVLELAARRMPKEVLVPKQTVPADRAAVHPDACATS